MTNQEAITKLTNIMHDDHYAWHPSILEAFRMAVDALRGLPSAQPTHDNTSNALKSLDCIYGADAIDALCKVGCESKYCGISCDDVKAIEDLSSAQPEQRYTEEELRVFAHGISLSLLSKRSAQHWQYDEDTATEIKFLERLYEKVGADMKGGQE